VIFVVLPIWVIWKISSGLFRWAFKRRDDGGPASDVPPASESSAGPSSDGSDSIDPF
jgi:hypothetical protein